MFYFAHTKLGFTEQEFWKLTLRKYIALRDEYINENTDPEEKEIWALKFQSSALESSW